MWLFNSNVNNTLSSLINSIIPNGTTEKNQLTSFTEMYKDASLTIMDLQDRSSGERTNWIEKTYVKQDLMQMVDILVKEEEEIKKKKSETNDNNDEIGVCLDYLIKNHIIDYLCGIAMVDNPEGSTALITSMLTKLFKEIQYPLLSTESLYITISALVQKLMQIYQVKNVSIELEKTIIQFVEVVCDKLCEDPVLINAFYIKDETSSDSSQSKASFPLVEPLIPHINDSSQLGITSRRILLLLIGFPLTDISVYLTKQTPIVKLLTQNLLDSILQYNSDAKIDTQLVLPEEVLNSRLTFLSELLSLCKSSAEFKDKTENSLILYHAICKSLEEIIFYGYFETELLNLSNERIITSTRVLRLIIHKLLPMPSSPLLQLIIHYLFGNDPKQQFLLKTLISRINCNSTDVSIVTMQLFNVLLKSQSPLVLSQLIHNSSIHKSETPLSEGSYFEQFCKCFQEPLPEIERFQAHHPSQVVNQYISDVEHAIVEAHRDKPQESNEDDLAGNTQFIDLLLCRTRMLLRQSMEVNLEVTQLITTISIIASKDEFYSFFLSSSSHSFVKELDIIWKKAISRSKEIMNFDRYLKMSETSLNVCDHTIGIQREDQMSVDVTFKQFCEGYVVLREFLIELTCSIMMRGDNLLNM